MPLGIAASDVATPAKTIAVRPDRTTPLLRRSRTIWNVILGSLELPRALHNRAARQADALEGGCHLPSQLLYGDGPDVDDPLTHIAPTWWRARGGNLGRAGDRPGSGLPSGGPRGSGSSLLARLARMGARLSRGRPRWPGGRPDHRAARADGSRRRILLPTPHAGREHRVAPAAAHAPGSMATSTLKRVLVGRALASHKLEHQLLPKFLALPVFSSDPLSSNAYATQEMMLVLVTAGA